MGRLFIEFCYIGGVACGSDIVALHLANRSALQSPGFSFRPSCNFFHGLAVGGNKLDVAHTQCLRKMKQGHDGWIALAALQATDILLRESRMLCETLLGEAFREPQPCKISPDQLAHVHARKLTAYTL